MIKKPKTKGSRANNEGVAGSDENTGSPQEQEEVHSEVKTQEKIENELFEESESLIPEMNELKELREKINHPKIQEAIKHAKRSGEWE